MLTQEVFVVQMDIYRVDLHHDAQLFNDFSHFPPLVELRDKSSILL
jgi:hypothetical protein